MTTTGQGALLLLAMATAGAHAGAQTQAQERTAASPAAPASAECRFEDAGHGRVRAVLDGRTLVLEDGREVVLSGLVWPEEERGGPAKDNNKAALQDQIGGRAVVLKRLGPDTDRYGRLPAHVFAGDDWVQHKLLAAGHARVAARVGDFACAARLLQAERAARSAKLGLWADPSQAPRQAADPASILAERGRFILVEGRVISVRESGGTIYVNFGQRWSEDFTATALRRNEKMFATAGLDLKKLAGRNVRVRGVIEERGGPWIELNRPEQIEVIGRD